jgi:hypothetical protein
MMDKLYAMIKNPGLSHEEKGYDNNYRSSL